MDIKINQHYGYNRENVNRDTNVWSSVYFTSSELNNYYFVLHGDEGQICALV